MQLLLVLGTLGLLWRANAWTNSAFSSPSRCFISKQIFLSSYDDEKERNGLVVAGELLADVSENAGAALIRAGQAWTVDWSEVTEAFEVASQEFYKMVDTNKLYESIAEELEDASTIEGCTSVGPPSSVPNLIAIKEHLEAISNEGDGYDPTGKAAEALSDLISTF